MVDFFESFGVNPLFIYVMAGVIAVLVGAITVTYQEKVSPSNKSSTDVPSNLFSGMKEVLLPMLSSLSYLTGQ